MTVLSIILGVLLIIGGFSLMFTPLVTFLGVGYFLIILFFILGILGIIRAVMEKRYGLEFAFSIIILILGILGLIIPGAAMMDNFAVLFLAAAWFLVHGVYTIIHSIRGKKIGVSTGMIVLGVILGILELVLGIYSIAHPFVLAVTIGILIGFYFIEAGINLIVVSGGFSGGNGAGPDAA